MSESSLIHVEVIERIVFSRWRAPPRKGDVEGMLTLLAETRRRLGAPLVYVGVVDARAPIPDAEHRALLHDFIIRGRESVEACFMVIEGSDLEHKLQRLLFSSAILITRTLQGFIRVGRSGDAIVWDVGKVLKTDVRDAFRKAREAGLFG